MTRAERYLEKKAELQKRDWEQNLPPPRRASTRELKTVALRDAPSTFQDILQEILRGCEPDAMFKQSHVQLGFNSTDFVDSDPSNANINAPNTFTATVVGSSQQGKTTMLNSLLNLFGFDFLGKRTFLDRDLLPTHSKNRAGLPFPVRLEYNDRFELSMERWTAEDLEALVQIVADKALEKDQDFFQDVEDNIAIIEKGSFLEFVSQHCQVDDEGSCCACKPSAAAALQADGGFEIRRFEENVGFINPSLASHQAVFSSLLAMVDQQWFRYRRVTLRCPSQLLKQMKMAFKYTGNAHIIDLPGVGIDDDNNTLVEELVFREVAKADTIIVLTGQRSLTLDILRVLRNSVFERLLDPTVVPPPTVAVTNSEHLLGMQEGEMEQWRNSTLHGTMGWSIELKAFADERFSHRRRHRLLSECEPSLFPHDLRGFLAAGPHAQDVGVAFLVGYFMRLPQETSVAFVSDVLERANAYKSMVDELWQAPMLVTRNSASTSRLAKQAMENRKDEFQMALASKLTTALQQEMFKWEEPRSLQEQLHEMDVNIDKELERLRKKFVSLKDDSPQMKEQVPQLVKQVLLELAADWDNTTGKVVFERFLGAARELALQIYKEWVPKLFNENSRSSEVDPKVKKARETVLRTLETRVPILISSSAIHYTLTDSFCQLVRNLDAREVFKSLGLRQGRSIGVTHEKLWRDVQELVRKKSNILRELVEKHVIHPHRSHHIKELISRLKLLITETFDGCVKNFETVTLALESIALGQTPTSKDPTVILQKDLRNFTNQLNEYLQKHRQTRDQFGAEELKAIQQARYGPSKVVRHGHGPPLESGSKRART